MTLKYILIPAFFLLAAGQMHAQSDGNETPAPASPEMTKLKEAVEKNPDSLYMHKNYIAALDIDDPKLEEQYRVWMNKYPRNANIPFAIGKAYANYERP